MREKVNHAAIGGFVLGALILAVAGILVFGSGIIMKKTHRHVLFFEGGLQGLSTGAAVAYRGVRVGSVVDISIQMDATDMTTHIPVIIEVESDRFEILGGDLEDDVDRNIQKLIDKGLRAKLVTESFVTGKLMIELGLYPDTPVRLLGLDTRYSEIPTIPSTIEEIRNTLKSLPVEQLFTKTLGAVEAIEKIASSPEILQAVTSFKLAAEDFQRLSNDVNSQVALLSEGAGDTMGDYRQLARRLDEGVVSTMVELNGALTAVTRSFEQVESSLMAVEDMVSDDSLIGNELENMLKEFTAAARSLRDLTQYLERHPEALIQGKREEGR